jgi:hypothetical protein
VIIRDERERLLFVNKKKQKNFFMLGHGRCRRQSLRPSITEVFAPLFSKSGFFPSAPLRAPTDWHMSCLKLFVLLDARSAAAGALQKNAGGEGPRGGPAGHREVFRSPGA